MGDPSGTPADYVLHNLAAWVDQQGESIDPADLKQAIRIARKLQGGKSVWTVTFITSGGLILLGGCSQGFGFLAFLAAFFVGGIIASGVSFVTSRPNSRDRAFLMRIARDNPDYVMGPVKEPDQ